MKIHNCAMKGDVISPEQNESTLVRRDSYSNENKSIPKILFDNSHQWKVFQSVLKKLKEYPVNNNE